MFDFREGLDETHLNPLPTTFVREPTVLTHNEPVNMRLRWSTLGSCRGYERVPDIKNTGLMKNLNKSWGPEK